MGHTGEEAALCLVGVFGTPLGLHDLRHIGQNDAESLRVLVLGQIIADVNDTQVDPVDILSYSLYQYSPEDGLQIAA